MGKIGDIAIIGAIGIGAYLVYTQWGNIQKSLAGASSATLGNFTGDINSPIGQLGVQTRAAYDEWFTNTFGPSIVANQVKTVIQEANAGSLVDLQNRIMNLDKQIKEGTWTGQYKNIALDTLKQLQDLEKTKTGSSQTNAAGEGVQGFTTERGNQARAELGQLLQKWNTPTQTEVIQLSGKKAEYGKLPEGTSTFMGPYGPITYS